MSKAALVQLLDCWREAHECDPDSSLLTRFLTKRDEDAFATLVHRHGPLVYGTCQRILGNRADTDDAFQAVFFVLARRAYTLKLDRSIGPWLHGVALRVAKKLRGQIVKRRLREMAAAKSERVEATELEHDFWVILDEELARLSLPVREVVLLCDLSGQSHAQTAKLLGLAKGTVTKRLAKAHEELAIRLKRRGITLGVGALSTLIATQASASVPAPLLLETAKQAVAFSIWRIGSSVTAKALAEGVVRSLKLNVLKVWLVVALLGLTLTSGGLMLAGRPGDSKDKKLEQPPPKVDAKPEAAKVGRVWKECFTCEYNTSLPVSVAFSADGKTLLIGDTNGEVEAVIFGCDPPTYRWKSKGEGLHAAVAYSADQKRVYATTTHGIRILDAATGQEVARIEERDSNPIAVAVFPNRDGRPKIVFGNARGYFVKSWADEGKIADTVGTIETSTVAKDAKPADVAAVPLAVDPQGRSAIMTGPRDATGQVSGAKGKNVLWAYVCGDYEAGSPGNRVLVGHRATVVLAAWSKEGSTAVTGDADGRVIVWDAKTMKETRRVELGGRVVAVAITDDGTHTAALVRGKQGGQVYVWETAKPAKALRSIHTQLGEFGSEPYGNLTFSSDGKRLAGCVIDKKWLPRDPQTLLHGQVHVWELAAEPKAQPAPNHLYTKRLPKDYSASFVILDNYTILTAATKEGVIDLRDIKNGDIQARFVLGKFAIGEIKLSADRKWFALEQKAARRAEAFDVGVYLWPPIHKGTIRSCSQLLDVASGGNAVAVVRDKQIELWDGATTKKLKAAPFSYTRIDAARFSPDGNLLAISDHNELVLWRWQENTHERLHLGRYVGSLTFTPDSKYLAEGPTPWDTIQIRDLETRTVVQTLADGAKPSPSAPRMAYTQGGRVLITCDNLASAKEMAVPRRISLWDTANGSLARQVALPAGLPSSIDVSPNGRYLAAMLDDGSSGLKLSVWRLDGEKPVAEPGRQPPASGQLR
jgi:RNA polymerase sigma factor (sigma-70 family)